MQVARLAMSAMVAVLAIASCLLLIMPARAVAWGMAWPPTTSAARWIGVSMLAATAMGLFAVVRWV